MNKKWVFVEVDEQKVDELHKNLEINRTLCRLLVQRGITDPEQAKKFFRPSFERDLYDPFIMKDMDKAVERIDNAIRRKEKILIYGDYDVDGTTSVALVYSFFNDFYFYLDYYIPDRYEEGYGISEKGIEWAKENGFDLIIALDCGIKAVEKVAYAKELGVDFIICDHHRPGEVIPDAYAVLDPKRPDCPYPFKELSACGIGFKLVQAFASTKGIPTTKVKSLLDLVVVSIAADIVPIVDENRVLAYYGLKRLNRSPRPGLRSLIEMSARNKRLSISDIIFIIAPRINAAGRMDDAKHAVRLLISTEGMIAKDKANVLQEKNTARRLIDSDITDKAFRIVRNIENFDRKKSIALYEPDWHKGVIGIVASRLLEQFYRPTIVMTSGENDDLVAGSARSIQGFDIYNAIKECSELLDQFGGHKYAAGLSVRRENVPAFIEKFEKVVEQRLDEALLVPELTIDSELKINNLNKDFFRTLRRFAPFGPHNTKPLFLSTELVNTGWSSVVGNNHLRICARQNGDTKSIRGIGYNMGDRLIEIIDGQPFNACFTIQENPYKGHYNMLMNFKDFKMLPQEEPLEVQREATEEDEEKK